jgi:hypothetical protein
MYSSIVVDAGIAAGGKNTLVAKKAEVGNLEEKEYICDDIK